MKRSYSRLSVRDVRNESARRFLCDVGLPLENPLFAFAEPVDRRVESLLGFRDLVKIGDRGQAEEYCVDVDSGEIVSVTRVNGHVWHVNESPEKFMLCLQEFALRAPYGSPDDEPEDIETMASALKDSLMKIDGTVLDEDPGFWYSIIDDVAVGDYSGS